MASSIDATKPTAGSATTASVRANFLAAKNEIEALQGDVASKQAALVSGTNIKTVNGTSLLGSGDLAVGGGGVTDHGALTGLDDDDHTQYLNNTRGDARYSQLGHVHAIADVTGLQTALEGKQPTLVSGTNIKTVNGTSILGSGDIVISGGGGGSGTQFVAYAGTNNTTSSTLRSGSAVANFFSTSTAGVFATTASGNFLQTDFLFLVRLLSVAYKNSNGAQWAPSTVHLEGSNDGTNWTTVTVHTDDGTTNVQSIAVSSTAAYRYWRVLQATATRQNSSGYEWHVVSFSMSAVVADVSGGGITEYANMASLPAANTVTPPVIAYVTSVKKYLANIGTEWLELGADVRTTYTGGNNDSLWSSVVLLIDPEGPTGSPLLTDFSPNPVYLVGAGAGRLSTAQKRFGSSSFEIIASGAGVAISPAGASAISPGAGDFCIEAWAWLASPTAYQFLFGESTGASGQMMIAFNQPGGNIGVGLTGVSWPMAFSGFSVAANTWFHIAITRSGTSCRCFIDGTQIGSTVTDSTNYPMTNPFIGGTSGGATMNGYIDGFRITKGAARYTANFTAPTAPFPKY